MLKNQPKSTAAATPAPAETPAVNRERIRNYLRVAKGVIPDALEELTHQVIYMPVSEHDWWEALLKVDDLAESPGRRAAFFHLLIEQSAGDALAGDPVAWQSRFDPSRNYESGEWMRLTVPEQIADIVRRIRREFPEIVAAEQEAQYGLTQAHIDSLGITEEDITEAVAQVRSRKYGSPPGSPGH